MRKILPENTRHTFDGCGQPLVGVRLGQRDPLNDTTTLRIHAADAVNHQIGDGWIEQQRPNLLWKERKDEVVAHCATPDVLCREGRDWKVRWVLRRRAAASAFPDPWRWHQHPGGSHGTR